MSSPLFKLGSSVAVVLLELHLALNFVSSVLAVVVLWEQTIPNAKPALLSGTTAITGPSGEGCQGSYDLLKTKNCFLTMLSLINCMPFNC